SWDFIRTTSIRRRPRLMRARAAEAEDFQEDSLEARDRRAPVERSLISAALISLTCSKVGEAEEEKLLRAEVAGSATFSRACSIAAGRRPSKARSLGRISNIK